MAKTLSPNLDNVTDGAIVDELAKLSLIENYSKRMRKFYRTALFARLGIKEDDEGRPVLPDDFANKKLPEGEQFSCTLSPGETTRISAEKVKAKYPDTWESELTTTSTSLTLRTALREGATNPIVNELVKTLMRELDLEE